MPHVIALLQTLALLMLRQYPQRIQARIVAPRTNTAMLVVVTAVAWCKQILQTWLVLRDALNL